MSNTSYRQIEKIMSIALGYSRVFGIYSHSYDFQRNQVSFSRRIFTYTVLFNILMIVFLPVCFAHQFNSHRRRVAENPVAVDIERSIALGHVVTMCVSYVYQCTNLPKYKLLYEQLTVVRTAECSKLKRNPTIIARSTAFILLKLFLSMNFLGGSFASVILRIDKFSVTSVLVSVYIVTLENVVLIVENQFYFGMLLCGFLFEHLNQRTVEVVQRIRRTERRRLQRKRIGVIMQKCCSLSDDLDSIGRMHTDIFNLATSIIKLFGIQIYIIMMTTLTTQVLLGFHTVVYLGRNSFQMSLQLFLISCTGWCLITLNAGLLIYVCSNAVRQCNFTGECLKELSSLRRMDSRLEVNIELLSFQMKHEALRVSLGGMIDIDMSTGFYLIRTAVMNLVLLIQYDYKNL